jgi:hypothetical protein
VAEKIVVRATVNLPKLKVGRTALVDPKEPYVAACLNGGLVVPVQEPKKTAGGG